MDKLIKERESIMNPPQAKREEVRTTVYENKGPTYLNSPMVKNKNGESVEEISEDDLFKGTGGFVVSDYLRKLLAWDKKEDTAKY